MSTQGSQTKLTFDKDLPNNQQTSGHAILEFTVLRKVINSFMPELLENTPTAKARLDQMEAYLSGANNRIVKKQLEKSFPEEICTVLYGLKALLRGRNMNVVGWVLEDSKARFGELLEDALEEE
jgi:hypothetical protein